MLIETRHFASTEEMQAHYAKIKQQVFKPNAPEPKKPDPIPAIEYKPKIISRSWSQYKADMAEKRKRERQERTKARFAESWRQGIRWFIANTLEGYDENVVVLSKQQLHSMKTIMSNTGRRKLIATYVASRYGVQFADLITHGRSRMTRQAKFEMYWALRTGTDMSLPQIGAWCGGKDHTTVRSGIIRYETWQKMALEGQPNPDAFTNLSMVIHALPKTITGSE